MKGQPSPTLPAHSLIPEGAMSTEWMDKVATIQLDRLLDEYGLDDLKPVVGEMAHIQLLADAGHLQDAVNMADKTARRHPRNRWAHSVAQQLTSLIQ